MDDLIEGSYKLYCDALKREETKKKMMKGKSKYSIELTENKFIE